MPSDQKDKVKKNTSTPPTNKKATKSPSSQSGNSREKSKTNKPKTDKSKTEKSKTDKQKTDNTVDKTTSPRPTAASGRDSSQNANAAKQQKKLQSWLDDVIKRFQENAKNAEMSASKFLSCTEVVQILDVVKPLVEADGSLLECPLPCKVIGDIHGQFAHLHDLLELVGRPPKERLLFLGDYVDRGPHSTEVVLYLFCLKCRHPDRVFLLRGNHETPMVNRAYGFLNELMVKFGAVGGNGLWWELQRIFNWLPLAGLIGKKVLCMHGGLSPELKTLDVIRQLHRPCEPQDSGILTDLLWSDPTNQGDGWFQPIRGVGFSFGKGVVDEYCNTLGIDLIIRGHQVVQDGYEFMVGRKLITVFSAPNYCGQFSNAAAVVCIGADLSVSFQQMRVPLPAGMELGPAPVIAAELPEGSQTTPPGTAVAASSAASAASTASATAKEAASGSADDKPPVAA